MTIGGLLFIIGAALQAGAVHLAMLIVGRDDAGLRGGPGQSGGYSPPAPCPLTLLFMQACSPAAIREASDCAHPRRLLVCRTFSCGANV